MAEWILIPFGKSSMPLEAIPKSYFNFLQLAKVM
jgi:hypothetical protein